MSRGLPLPVSARIAVTSSTACSVAQPPPLTSQSLICPALNHHMQCVIQSSLLSVGSSLPVKPQPPNCTLSSSLPHVTTAHFSALFRAGFLQAVIKFSATSIAPISCCVPHPREHHLRDHRTLGEGIAGPCLTQVVLVVKNLPANAGDIRDSGSIPGSGRSPGGGHGNPLQ